MTGREDPLAVDQCSGAQTIVFGHDPGDEVGEFVIGCSTVDDARRRSTRDARFHAGEESEGEQQQEHSSEPSHAATLTDGTNSLPYVSTDT